MTKFKPEPPFNPFFVFIYLVVLAVFGLLSFILLAATVDHDIKNKGILLFATAFLSLLLTHIVFRFVGKGMKTSRGQAIDGSDVFIPFYYVMRNAPYVLNLIAWFLRCVFKTEVDFEANGNYSEWIAVATAFQLILVAIIAFCLILFAH